MLVTKNHEPKGVVELTIELSPQEFEPFRQEALKQISQTKSIPGFRPGSAPNELVERTAGQINVLETAAELAAKSSYSQAVRKENIQSITAPLIKILKLAPDNPFIFRASVAILPEVTLGKYESIQLKRKQPELGENEISKAINDLRKMHTVEVVISRPVGAHDKVTIDLDMTLDSVLIEGGQARTHSIYMDDDYFISGLKEQLLGMSKNEKKIFRLPFPKTHYNKNLAGKEVDFSVSVKDVYELQKPPLDDAFAKKLGQNNLKSLETLIETNLKEEAKLKANQEFEVELLECAVEKTKFGEIPEILVERETKRMAAELENSLGRQGVAFEDYLQNIHKSRPQLLLDFTTEALKRVKVSLLLRAIADHESITIKEEDIKNEIKNILGNRKNNIDTQKEFQKPEMQDYLRALVRNRKAIAFLAQKIKIDEKS